jgi:hypothetical protein
MTTNRNLFSSLLVVTLLHLSSGFSAWLPCHRYLEEDEVIMNNKVVEAPADTDDIVRLAVYDSSGTRVDTDSIVWIDGNADATTRSLSYNIRVDPSTADGLMDLQYVVETHPFTTTSSAPNAGAPSPRVPSAPAPSAPTVRIPTTGFTGASAGGGVLCDGMRAHARGKTGSVAYEIAASTIVSSSGEGGGVLSEVWAGYAEGHSKVTLTPKIYFKLRDPSGNTDKDEL